MSRHPRKTPQKRIVATYLAAGITGAAMAAVGMSTLLNNPAPGTPTLGIRLVSYQDCSYDPVGCDNTDLGSSAAAATVYTAQTSTDRPVIGEGGWLIGDGRNAAADCTGAACNGENGGLLGGSGGNGANGGKGGDAGAWWGNGGKGGDGLDAVYVNGAQTQAATAGGNGGHASHLVIAFCPGAVEHRGDRQGGVRELLLLRRQPHFGNCHDDNLTRVRKARPLEVVKGWSSGGQKSVHECWLGGRELASLRDTARRLDWSVIAPSLGSVFLLAGVLGGLGALPPEEAVYFVRTHDDAGTPLDGRQAWRLRLPPGGIPADSFWSFSMYAPTADGQRLRVALAIVPDEEGATATLSAQDELGEEVAAEQRTGRFLEIEPGLPAMGHMWRVEIADALATDLDHLTIVQHARRPVGKVVE